jgi:hypothetical protein
MPPDMVGPIVTLLTDFGTVDGFVGAMKGAILSRAPTAQVVDVTHDVPPHDVLAGAWALREAVAAFPRGSIHLAVVDPGVGTSRRPLLLRSAGQLFVGPDNGLLSLAAAEAKEGWILDRPAFHAPVVSPTFHGRDVFASVAGHLAAGLVPATCGTPTESWMRIRIPEAVRSEREIRGRVIRADRFGNLVTNIRAEDLNGPSGWQVRVAGTSVGPIRAVYGEVAPGAWVAYVGSGGALEIAIREGNAWASDPRIRDAEVVLWKA